MDVYFDTEMTVVDKLRSGRVYGRIDNKI